MCDNKIQLEIRYMQQPPDLVLQADPWRLGMKKLSQVGCRRQSLVPDLSSLKSCVYWCRLCLIYAAYHFASIWGKQRKISYLVDNILYCKDNGAGKKLSSWQVLFLAQIGMQFFYGMGIFNCLASWIRDGHGHEALSDSCLQVECSLIFLFFTSFTKWEIGTSFFPGNRSI